MTEKDKEIEKISLRLKEIEKNLNVKKKFIAEKAGINVHFYYSVSMGRQPISFDLLFKICTTYNISPNWLIFGEGEMFRQNNEPPPLVDPEVEKENKILSEADKEIKKIYINMMEHMMLLDKSEQSEIVKNMYKTLMLILKKNEN
jgi:transcriptional regulator with XRE-family HTH domain